MFSIDLMLIVPVDGFGYSKILFERFSPTKDCPWHSTQSFQHTTSRIVSELITSRRLTYPHPFGAPGSKTTETQVRDESKSS